MAFTVTNRCVQAIAHANLKFDSLGCVIFSASAKWQVPYKEPPSYDHVQYPERRRMKILQKVPNLDPSTRPPKHTRMLGEMRGPELVHNKLQYGDYGVQVILSGRITHSDSEKIRMIIVRQMDERNMFAYWRVNSLWQSVTRKGKGQRMGGGKGSINHYVHPVKAERVLLEIGGECEFIEVYPMLKEIVRILPFQARIITHKSVQDREEREEWREKSNLNPFNFKHVAQNNILGCHQHLNRYDHMWYNKYQ